MSATVDGVPAVSPVQGTYVDVRVTYDYALPVVSPWVPAANPYVITRTVTMRVQ